MEEKSETPAEGTGAIKDHGEWLSAFHLWKERKKDPFFQKYQQDREQMIWLKETSISGVVVSRENQVHVHWWLNPGEFTGGPITMVEVSERRGHEDRAWTPLGKPAVRGSWLRKV
jgi:hypothetical protein